MSAIYSDAIEMAAKTLEVGQEMVWEFGGVQEAHAEYMKFSREMKKKTNNPAVRALNLSRRGNCIVLGMDRPEYLFPKPSIVQGVNAKRGTCDNGAMINAPSSLILQRMKDDLADGLMSQEDFDEQVKTLGL